ncbi:MAG: insulinase family protein, partial [Fimbriimonadales bacterium]|nr:insulinase family protein [Fimbriimonadales bacterium]
MNGWLLALLITTFWVPLAPQGESASIQQSSVPHAEQGEPAGGGRLIIHPDPDAPLVAIEVWVQAGSACETRETSGAAHLLEHLIFKGTAQHPAGALDATIESAGGVLEASTERDWTRYRMAVLPDRWEPALRMLLEHLLAPALPEAALQRERELILQDEYALHRADPIRVARYALYAKVYGEHPYALPPLGIPESLAKLSREQLLEFHARHYRLDRMVIVVAGPVEPARVREVCLDPLREVPPASKGNQNMPASPLQRRNLQEGVSYFHAESGRDAGSKAWEVDEGAILAIGVVAPPATQPDAMLAAEVIRLALAEPHFGLLGVGREWQLVSSEYTPRPQPGLMLFFFQPYPDAGDDWQQQVRQRWEASTRRIVEGQARPQLEWAKQQLIARHQQAMRNPLERARLYALYATLGLPTLPDEYASRVQSLTAEQIEGVARTMLDGNPLLQVSPYEGGTASSSRTSQVPPHEREPVSASRFPPHRGGNLQEGGADGSIFHQTLANGMRIIALPQPGARQIVLQLLIATGPDAERDLPPGTSELTARMLFTATRNETQASLAHRIAHSGGTLQLHWEPIGVRITAVAEPATIENVLSLLREGLTRAEFEPDALKNALQAALAERHLMDSVHELPLYDTLFRQLHEAGSLYASTEQLQKVRLEEIKAFHRRSYRPDRFVMVIAGDLSVERLTELTQRYFGMMDALEDEASAEPRFPASLGMTHELAETTTPVLAGAVLAEPSTSIRHFVISPFRHFATSPFHHFATSPLRTFYIGFGLRVAVRSPEEYAALLVLQALLCEGKGSALFQQFREVQGVGYAFGGRALVWQGEGTLLGFLQVGAERASQREELLSRLRTVLRQSEWEPDALKRAVALVEGRWRRDRLEIFEWTRRLALAEASGVGYHAELQLPDLLKKVK